MPDLQTLAPHTKDLGGGFVVRRSLPAAQRQAVGPFVFFDHFGPLDVPAGAHHDVRPHPHIGLATLTYLFEGAIMHRDSTGVVQRIDPGAVNWMSAGRGIVHSERTPKELIDKPHRSHGLQLWIALPEAEEDSAPSFQHVPAEAIPRVRIDGATAHVVAGSAYGATSPVKTVSPMFYADIALEPGATISMPDGFSERALYLVDGAITIGADRLEARHMAVIAKGASPKITADGPVRLVVLGGEPLDGPRYIWWNFVSSSPEKIHEAAAKWRAGDWAKVFDDTVEFTPAPADGPKFAGER